MSQGPEQTRVGVDDWVAEHGERVEQRRGLGGYIERALGSVPPAAQLGFFALVAATLPFWMNTGDLFAYGIFTLIYILLGLGLNVIVGYAGLLDLGYVAFFGFGAYAFGLLASEHYGNHWPTMLAIPVVMLGTALLGLILGFTSRRLLGDYLAIVTLFFGQAFVVFVNAANPTVRGRGLTGGPNGVADIDQLDLFGYDLTTRKQEYFFLLGSVVIVLAALHFIGESRTGRSWRALREDPLAAEAMGIPVNRLKLLAFAIGAAIAGLAGCIFAPVLSAVSPGNFGLPILITIYAIVILGGIGSLTGVVIGAIVINISFQFLAPENPQSNARVLFFFVLGLLLVLAVKPRWIGAALVAATIVFGFVTQFVVEAVAPSWSGGPVTEGGRLADLIQRWVVIPEGHADFGNVAYVSLVVLVLVVTRLHGWWRTAALVPTAYLAVIVWETSFVEQPQVARWILFGALLITLMTVRPQGLLGTPRVEIV